jgi:hypothetical protein
MTHDPFATLQSPLLAWHCVSVLNSTYSLTTLAVEFWFLVPLRNLLVCSVFLQFGSLCEV